MQHNFMSTPSDICDCGAEPENTVAAHMNSPAHTTSIILHNNGLVPSTLVALLHILN